MKTVSKTANQNELSIRAFLLGVMLSAILAAANAYLGLFAGMTVSASIPAAVVSMGLMRAVRGGILENNLVQTAASAGESAAAGAIFTLPALLLLGSWTQFPWLDCFLLVGSGGALGVLFTVFLRRPLIVEGELPYPEGVATAQVLIAGHSQSDAARTTESAPADSKLRVLFLGGLLGGAFKFFESGLGLCRATLEGATRLFGGSFYLGASASPALLAVGYIVGLRIAFLVCLGGLLNWLFVIPWITAGSDGGTALETAWSMWSTQTRYLGVGAMTFSGLFTLFQLRSTLFRAVKKGTENLGRTRGEELATQRDLPRTWINLGVAVCGLVLTWMFSRYLPSWGGSFLVALFVLGISFLFSAVAAYMAGLLGSSNNPVSGVTIATIIFVSLMLVAVGVDSKIGAMATIFVGSVVCTAAAIGGDNMQDLKAGHLLGASPYRQQLMQLSGVASAALVLGQILQLLSESYGFFQPTETHPRPLMAPQASLMAEVARGMFGGNLPWNLIFVGVGFGVAVSAVDTWLERRKSAFRTPPLALSLGLYLPLELSTPVLLGGIAAHFAKNKAAHDGADAAAGAGVLMSAGLITGEALMGVVLAGAILLIGDFGALRLEWNSGLLSVAFMVLVVVSLIRAGAKRSQG